MEVTIGAEQHGERLDKALTVLLPHYSRATIQKFIESGRVLVQGGIITKHATVHEGDRVVIDEGGQSKEQLTVGTAPRIIEENDEYIVIDKPTGLLVHLASHSTGPTVVDHILARYPEVRTIGDDPIRPGIVHRLDKDASGVMVIARTQDSFESLKSQFKLRQVKKEYRILVHGSVTPEEGVIRSHLSRSKRQYTRFAAHADETGREAITRYWVERTVGQKYTLVRVLPETGRTHQIRVHFFSRGYPLVGDPVYKQKSLKSPETTRLMLHATVLEFKDREGNMKSYTVDPSADFMDVVELLATV